MEKGTCGPVYAKYRYANFKRSLTPREGSPESSKVAFLILLLFKIDFREDKGGRKGETDQLPSVLDPGLNLQPGHVP